MTRDVDELLVAEIRRRLCQAVRRVCPGWLASQAEDIVQTALMRIVDAANKKGERNPDLSSLYLEKAAYSATVDEIRRQRRRREEAVEGNRLKEFPSSAASNPESLAAAREMAAEIRDCLRELVAPRRLGVTLHLQGHSAPEVAALMSWSTKRAENSIYRGLADLRRCLATKGLAG